MLGLFVFLGIGFTVAVLLGAWFVAYRISRPSRKTAGWALGRSLPSDPSELDAPLAFREFEFTLPHKRSHDRFPAWEIDGARPEGPVVVMTPGWGGSRIGMLARVAPFARTSAKLILWDPPGHGDAPGPWHMGTKEPAMLLEIAREMREAFGKPVVLFGASAGAGISIVTAAMDAASPEGERAVGGVIAEAPYRLPMVPAKHVTRLGGYPWALNGPIAFVVMGVLEGVGPRWRGFDRGVHAENVSVPTLVIHGDQDAVCPLRDGREIAERCDGEIVVIEGAGHNDLWKDQAFNARCSEAIERFLASSV